MKKEILICFLFLFISILKADEIISIPFDTEKMYSYAMTEDDMGRLVLVWSEFEDTEWTEDEFSYSIKYLKYSIFDGISWSEPETILGNITPFLYGSLHLLKDKIGRLHLFFSKLGAHNSDQKYPCVDTYWLYFMDGIWSEPFEISEDMYMQDLQIVVTGNISSYQKYFISNSGDSLIYISNFDNSIRVLDLNTLQWYDNILLLDKKNNYDLFTPFLLKNNDLFLVRKNMSSNDELCVFTIIKKSPFYKNLLDTTNIEIESNRYDVGKPYIFEDQEKILHFLVANSNYSNGFMPYLNTIEDFISFDEGESWFLLDSAFEISNIDSNDVHIPSAISIMGTFSYNNRIFLLVCHTLFRNDSGRYAVLEYNSQDMKWSEVKTIYRNFATPDGYYFSNGTLYLFVSQYVNSRYKDMNVLFDLSIYKVDLLKQESAEYNDDKINSKNLVTFPEPFMNDVNIKFYSKECSNGKIILYNIEGKKIFCKDIFINYGENIIKLTSSEINLASGMYILRLNYNNKDYFKKIIKIK